MESYAYAVGKIRVLERNLLPKPYLNKIAENSLEAITSELKIKEDFFSFLGNELKTTYDLIEKLLKNSSLSIILRLKYETYNLKLLLKKEIDSSISTAFSPLGAIPPSLLKDAIQTKATIVLAMNFAISVLSTMSFEVVSSEMMTLSYEFKSDGTEAFISITTAATILVNNLRLELV